jgi:hypothetical protein
LQNGSADPPPQLRRSNLKQLALRRYELRLQPFVHFFGAPQRFLNVVANVLFPDDLGEFRLVDRKSMSGSFRNYGGTN